MDQKYQDVVNTFKDDARVKVHRAMSDVALAALEDASLDWIYLDGNHNAPFIDNDIALSLKKVKHDGIIAGDDYNWMAEAKGAPVTRAVEAMVAALGDQASLTLMANQWIVKLNRPAP